MKNVHLLLATLSCLALGSISGTAQAAPAEKDPLQAINRKIFWFNDKADVWVLEPIARGWDFIVPDRVEKSLSNFFANLTVPSSVVNNFLQAKAVPAASELGRFLVNSTVGVAGLFDPASGWGLESREEDVGQTLGVWGIPAGPYLVLPFIGPSNPRDTAGFFGDSALLIYPYFVGQLVTLGMNGVRVVNIRSAYLEQVRDAKEAAIDYYSFVRNAYMQRRDALVADREEITSEQEEELYYFDE